MTTCFLSPRLSKVLSLDLTQLVQVKEFLIWFFPFNSLERSLDSSALAAIAKDQRPGSLHKQKFIVSQSRRREVQDQGASRFGSS